MFGENLPRTALNEGMYQAHKADVVILVGASGEVWPANDLVFDSHRQGAEIIEFNPTKTDFPSTQFYEPAEIMLPKLFPEYNK
jgi:NAD-dependent SIR2 family protein deacetylase